jgi:hypothetical protein
MKKTLALLALLCGFSGPSFAQSQNVTTNPGGALGQGIPQRLDALERQVNGLERKEVNEDQLLAVLKQQLTALQPLNLTVDCGGGQTVGAALAQAGQRASRVVITITGVCSESVTVNRSNTVLQAGSPGSGLSDPSANTNVLSINGAHDVTVNGLTLSGGAGVRIQTGHVSMVNSYVSGSSSHGVVIFGGELDVVNTTVEGSAIDGIQAISRSTLRLQSSVIQNNGFALDISDGSFALLDGNTQVINNRGNVGVTFGSMLHVGNAIVENNAHGGISLMGGSVAHFGFGGGLAVISGNSGDGLQLRDTSEASSLQEGWTVQIVNNTGFGVFCSGPPAVAQIVGQLGTVTGNTVGQINCPVSQ